MNPVNLFDQVAKIQIVGVGGAGGNAVDRMIEEDLEGVKFVALNSDRQALDINKAEVRVLIGEALNKGMGSGGDPERGAAAAKAAEAQISELVEGADMVFIAAGMGGGTGTGAAPVVARIAKRQGALVVAVVTKPFVFEGPRRKKIADEGVIALQKEVDTLIVLPNDKLISGSESSTTLTDAFRMADEVLRYGVQGISDIVVKPGLINVDFADVRAVLKDAGIALMGWGAAHGENAAKKAAQIAASSPLLETNIQGAKKLLVNVTAGPGLSLYDTEEAMNFIAELADAEDAAVYLGHVVDESMGEFVSVALIAAGMDSEAPRAEDSAVFKSVTRRESDREERSEPEIEKQSPLDVDDLDLDIVSFLKSRHE